MCGKHKSGHIIGIQVENVLHLDQQYEELDLMCKLAKMLSSYVYPLRATGIH